MIALLTGAVLGAAAGVLLAPASGQKTRRKLRKKAEGLRSQLTDLIDRGASAEKDARNAAMKASAQASRMVHHTMDGANSSYRQAQSSGTNA